MRVLLVYPNLPLMMSPSIAMGIFTALAKQEDCEVELFETTSYSDEYQNRHLRLAELGAVRQNKESETKNMFYIQPKDKVVPDYQSKLSEYKPDVIMMSLVEDVWDMAQTLLEAGAEYDIPTVLGGVFPTAAHDVLFEHPLVKYIAVHEGERTFVDIINAIKSGKDINTVNSIYWKDELSTIHRNPLQQLCDITDVIPDYSLFGENRYQRPMGGVIWQKAMSMETYRGCPYNCTYCNSPTTRDF